MKPEIKSHPIIDGLIEVFGNWLIHRREMRELRQLDSGEFDSIARDLRMTPADLDTFVRKGPHAADEITVYCECISAGLAEAISLEELRYAASNGNPPASLREKRTIMGQFCLGEVLRN
jgi:phage protein U